MELREIGLQMVLKALGVDDLILGESVGEEESWQK